MLMLIAGLIVFIAPHSVAMVPSLRASLISALGVKGYRAAYSVVSLLGLVLLVYGFGQYRAHGVVQVWTPPTGLRHLNLLLMLIAFIALFASQVPRGFIKAKLKHPMLVGVKVWAFGHLLANGDLGGMILFGTILAWAVVNRISYRWRPDNGTIPPEPRLFGDVLAVSIGTAVYVAMLYLHPVLIGVSVMG